MNYIHLSVPAARSPYMQHKTRHIAPTPFGIQIIVSQGRSQPARDLQAEHSRNPRDGTFFLVDIQKRFPPAHAPGLPFDNTDREKQ
jgi:hypothetical protein